MLNSKVTKTHLNRHNHYVFFFTQKALYIIFLPITHEPKLKVKSKVKFDL